MNINFKKLNKEAKTPYQANFGDAGFDLSVHCRDFDDNNHVCYRTGIAVEIPYGFVGLIFPRSSVYKTSNRLANCVGVIDSGYRGEVTATFDIKDGSNLYQAGERCCQLIIMPIPPVTFKEADHLSPSERGEGGYGSSGR